MKFLTKYLLLAMAAVVVSACTVSTNDTVLVSQPRSQVSSKVVDGTSEDLQEQAEIPQSIAILPFQNSTEENQASELLRQVINSQLAGKNFTLMHPAEVERRIPSGPVDYSKMASYLGVDGVLTGEVITFERFFAGIYAQIRLGVNLTLYNTNGDIIWSGEHEVVSSAGGVSTTAWGVLLNAAIAAMHLDDENLLAAADELGRKVASEFPQPNSYVGQTGPYIESVLHDQSGNYLRYGDEITVGIKGDPGALASVQIGNLLKKDLTEIEPGVYIGDIVVDPRWNETRVPVTGILQDGNGNTNTLLSITGLINFDNNAPSPVSELTGSQTEETLKLSWRSSEPANQYRVYVKEDGELVQIAQVPDPFINVVRKVPLFSRSDYQVVAIDAAGNESPPKGITLTAYAIEVSKQSFLTGPLQGDYDGILALTPSFSPYQVNGKVTFSSTSELYVEPGVELQFAPGASIEVLGEAYFWGVKDTIELRPLGDIKRKLPYLIINTEKAVQVTGVQLQNSGIGIDVKAGQPMLDVIEFVGSRFSALTLSGEADVTLRHCLIDGSNSSAIVVSDYAKLSVTGCTIRNNSPFHIQNASPYEVIAIDNKWEPEASPGSILGKVRTTNE